MPPKGGIRFLLSAQKMAEHGKQTIPFEASTSANTGGTPMPPCRFPRDAGASGQSSGWLMLDWGRKKDLPEKVEARRNECRNGLLFPPERDQSNTALGWCKSFF
jgi:hypothetical protein